MKASKLTSLMKLVLGNPSELQLQAAVDELLCEVREAMLSGADEKVLARYIRYLQVNCTELMDSTQSDALVCQWLRMLLMSLRKYYPEFYDHHAEVPLLIAEQGKKTLKIQGKLRYTKLKARMRDLELFGIIDQYFEGLLLKKHFSYLELDKQIALQDNIIACCTQADIVQFDEQFMDELVVLGYRDPRFVNHYMNQISVAVQVEATVSMQRIVLCSFQKRLLKMQLNNGIAEESSSGTYGILVNFVNSLLAEREMKGGYPELSVEKAGQRLKTTFSVDVLAYLARLCVDCGFLNGAAKSDLFSFLSSRIGSLQSGAKRLSPISIKNKYYLVVQSTAIQTRSMLMKMVHQIDLEFKL